MFVRSKIIDGKKRQYLVESYRDKATGKIRQRHIAYVDLWLGKDIAKLIGMIKKFREHWTNSEHLEHTKAFRRVALEKATTFDKAIAKFQDRMRINMVPVRNRVDRRRINSITGVRHLQYAHPPKDLYNGLIVLLKRVNSEIRELEKEIEMITWSSEMLDTFIRHSKFIHEKREEALRLLNATMKK